MSELPLSGETLEHLGCELWSLVRPDDVWCSITAEHGKEGIGKVGGGCILAHVNDFWPVGMTVNNNEELLSAVGAKINSCFLKQP